MQNFGWIGGLGPPKVTGNATARHSAYGEWWTPTGRMEMVVVRLWRAAAAAGGGRVATSRSEDNDGDEGDDGHEHHGCDDAVAEHTPGGATALLAPRRTCTPTFTFIFIHRQTGSKINIYGKFNKKAVLSQR